jgi:hypothetical protein
MWSPRGIRSLTIAVLLATAGCHHARHEAAPPQAAAYGRWLVGMPAWGVETVVEMSPRGDTVASTFLGQHGPVRIRSTTVQGDRFAMKLSADGQLLEVSGRVLGDSVIGRWYPDHWFKRRVAGGVAHGRRLSPALLAPLAQSTRAWGDTLQRVIEGQLYDPTLRGTALDSAWRAATRGMASAADDGAALAIVSSALARYGQSHLHLDAVPATHVLPPRAPSAAPRVRVTFRRLPNGMGVLRIRDFLDESPVAQSQLRAAMDSARSTTALLIDLRGNPGGSIVLADHLAAALSPTPVEVGVFVMRRGYERWGGGRVQRMPLDSLPRLSIGDTITARRFFTAVDRLGGAAVYVTRPGGAAAYERPVAVLIDGGTASTAEGVAVGLRDANRALLVGARTAGALLAAEHIDVAPGWQLTVPRADFWTVTGRRPEGVGIAPDVAVADSRRQPVDHVIEAAVALLTRTGRPSAGMP